MCLMAVKGTCKVLSQDKEAKKLSMCEATPSSTGSGQEGAEQEGCPVNHAPSTCGKRHRHRQRHKQRQRHMQLKLNSLLAVTSKRRSKVLRKKQFAIKTRWQQQQQPNEQLLLLLSSATMTHRWR